MNVEEMLAVELRSEATRVRSTPNMTLLDMKLRRADRQRTNISIMAGTIGLAAAIAFRGFA